MTRTPHARGRCAFDSVLSSLIGLLALASASCTSPPDDHSWADHDAASNERIDHCDWQVVLDIYLITDDPSGVNLVDYRALQANVADQQRLAVYLDYLQGLDPRRYAKAEQMAYWISISTTR